MNFHVMPVRRLMVVVAILAFAVMSLQAETPEQVVTKYFDKVKAGGFGAVVELMHPDELGKFREMMGPVVQNALQSERERDMFKSFADPQDPAKMRAMDDAKFMRTFLEWVEGLRPEITGILKDATVEALGHVQEKEIKHVVVRMKMKTQGIEVERMSVMSVKDYRGVPRLVLTGEMKGIAESIKRRR